MLSVSFMPGLCCSPKQVLFYHISLSAPEVGLRTFILDVIKWGSEQWSNLLKVAEQGGSKAGIQIQLARLSTFMS